jgi:hypothetical protein
MGVPVSTCCELGFCRTHLSCPWFADPPPSVHQKCGRAHFSRAPKLLKHLREFDTYIRNNQDYIPNYGERYRNGERIATGFVESTVNQVVSKRMVKRQQMQWTERGAHLLLQTRTKVLNGELDETFRRWYPKFRSETSASPMALAAAA